MDRSAEQLEMRPVCRGVPALTAAAVQFRHRSPIIAAAADAKMQPVGVHNSLLLAYSPGLDYLAVGTRDGRVKAFDTGAARLHLKVPELYFSSCAFLLNPVLSICIGDAFSGPVQSLFTSVCSHQADCQDDVPFLRNDAGCLLHV